jgi:hypothetical protein
MAHPVRFNTISYVIDRQYDDRCHLNKSYTRNKLRSARSFYRKDLLAHYGCVNAIEFSHDGKQLVSGKVIVLFFVLFIVTYIVYMHDMYQSRCFVIITSKD